jgi:2-polyprenyl-3-methyl-5-hydroxy-6-metoxy-1,4-benzoquinol methylase
MKCYVCGKPTNEIRREIRECMATLHQCPECGLVHLEPEQGDLKDYYANAYRKEYGPTFTNNEQAPDYEHIFNTYVKYQGQRVKVLEEYLGKDKTLLDVGCSTGHFLWNVKDKLKHVVGVDWDTGAGLYASMRKDIPTYQSIHVIPEQFDIVYSSMTLEHTSDPLQFINQCSSKLKKDGILYIEVPNLNDALITVYENKAYETFYYRKAHLWYFTPYAFLKLMAKAGFVGKLVFMQDYNQDNHLYWQEMNEPQNDCRGLGPAYFPKAGELYKDLLCRLHISDNMAFIGRKA